MNDILVIVLVMYIVLLNIITSYRLFKDDYYDAVQKSMQYLLIWCLPMVGSLTVAFFLNQNMDSRKKYPWALRVVAVLFMIKLVKDSHGFGYPSSMNDNGGCDGTGYNHCGGYGDAGGCGGGD